MSDFDRTIKRTPPDSDPPQGGLEDPRRRRLGLAALGAVPVVLSLRHRPVRAAWACHSPSGFSSMSLNTSYQPTEPLSCSGRSPGYWRTHPKQWPTGFDPSLTHGEGGTLFMDVFGGGAGHFYVPDPANLTMMGVLELNGFQDPEKMGAYCVAAMLNAASGRTDPLKPYTVRTIWQEFIVTGSYSPPPGVDTWDADLIKGYFESTWV